MRQVADILEAALGHARLPQGGRHPGHHRQQYQSGGRHTQLVLLHEFPRHIPGGIAQRQNRRAIQMAANIFGERGHRGIAVLRPLAQGFQHDGVEVAAQLPRRFCVHHAG